MKIKTGILAAAAALTLAIPAVASAQPYYGGGGYGFRPAPRAYGYGYRPSYRDARRYEAMRRWQWQRQQAYRYGGYGASRGYYGYGNPYYR